MAYCRFNEQSDLYVYSVGGALMVHVARMRVADPSTCPTLPPFPVQGPDLEARIAHWLAQDQARQQWLQAAPLEPIGLAFDGETRGFSDTEDALAFLGACRAAGYRVLPGLEESVKESAATD